MTNRARYAVRICSFTSTDELCGKQATYRNIKAAVLRAGRFSAFEACATQQKARHFSRLARDRTLRLTKLGYPWTRVERK